MKAYITGNDEEHVVCSQCPDSHEVQRSCKSAEDKRIIAAHFNGIYEIFVRKIRLTICDECIENIEKKAT